MCKQMSTGSLKDNVTAKFFTCQSYIMYKQDLVLNSPQGLICHKAQPS